jgi:hypothetical protein
MWVKYDQTALYFSIPQGVKTIEIFSHSIRARRTPHDELTRHMFLLVDTVKAL